MRLILSLAFIAITFPSAFAQAQESEFCGVPDPAAMDTEALGHCDIYQRQLAYREEALKLQELMKERQENFAAPRREAIKRYEEDMKALNEERSSEDY
ncbi:MAG: hypothetical protein AAF204_01540 [Pseudomonadota bacterium]